ncbi:cytochrome c oxidase assembly factor CtaG [Peribacillus kribbensis]|uniref:cytochrome c oxidase assembly factor CtaG n=1 Tax=Peribacillus kribbensis TaxID=356658 RepID=UPI00040C8CAA|nr:cytochrome c oxidase assembly factor CtaG [Peribacillus kribbensis]
MLLDMFSFRALWNPFFMLALIITALIFFGLALRYRSLFPGEEKLTKKQSVLFISAILILYIIKGSPFDLLGHIMFSVHMTQMALLYLLVVPMLVAAVPSWMWSRILKPAFINRPFLFFTKPLIALLVFNVFFSFYHIPFVFDFLMKNMLYHSLSTVFLFITAIFMWWPVIQPDGKDKELSGLQKIGYIFGNGILLTPACALIIFTKHPLYGTFSDPASWMQMMSMCVPASSLKGMGISGPELLNWLPLLEDQQLGGVIMKIIQEIVYGSMLGYIFFDWYKKENKKSSEETENLYEPREGYFQAGSQKS